MMLVAYHNLPTVYFHLAPGRCITTRQLNSEFATNIYGTEWVDGERGIWGITLEMEAARMV
jgi:hypothetical protein